MRDVALELRRRGHKPLVYSPRLGVVAEEIHSAGIPVVDDPRLIASPPDLIHGQHHLEAMTALAHFPGVPAVCFCHGWIPWVETPPSHPRILGYVVVSEILRDSLICGYGIPEDKVTIISNFVDTARFRPRGPLPNSPRKALLFDNLATEENYGRTIRQACSSLGITLDIAGFSNGNPAMRPETLLGCYDLVFARGRAALESLASGVAVICCGPEGAGPMVSLRNVEQLRRQNFGRAILEHAITVDWACERIREYDPADAMAVSRLIRERMSLTATVDRIIEVYQAIVESWETRRLQGPASEMMTAESGNRLGLVGEPPRNRTWNLLIKSQLLCQLS